MRTDGGGQANQGEQREVGIGDPTELLDELGPNRVELAIRFLRLLYKGEQATQSLVVQARPSTIDFVEARSHQPRAHTRAPLTEWPGGALVPSTGHSAAPYSGDSGIQVRGKNWLISKSVTWAS